MRRCGREGSRADVFLSAQPNPARRSVQVRYSVPTPQNVSITIYNITGRLVTSIFEGHAPAGPGELIWNGTTRSGVPASPGVYFCRIVNGHTSRSVRVVLIE